MAALSEEQSIVRDSARAWVRDKAPVAKLRELRDGSGTRGFSEDTWAEMVELGWTGIIVPDVYGGADLGYLAFGLILEELGRQLTASPLFATALVGASALVLGGDEAQKAAFLPAIVRGEEILTLAVDEGPRHAPARIALRAEARDGGFHLSGVKTFVPEGLAATTILVAARAEAGVTLFVVPADAPGVARTAMRTIDSRGHAGIEFKDVAVGAEAVLGPIGQAAPLLDAVLDRARAGLGAEMLGTGAQAFEMTLDYLKTREQFGRPIGSFQALGHRAAGLYSAMELARSCVEAALQAIDGGADRIPELCSLSQAKVGGFLHEMSNQLIQIHGGIGMTDEFDAGLYLKRARVQEALYGNRAFHRSRYARLLGF